MFKMLRTARRQLRGEHFSFGRRQLFPCPALALGIQEMRNALRAIVLFAAVPLTASTSQAFDLCRLLGIGCGDAYHCGATSCEPDCGFQADCGAEPTCGCAAGCGVNGRQFAGQTWIGSRECGPPICPCTGPSSCAPGCGCEPACGCASTCGCKSACARDGRGCAGCGCCFGSCCGRLIGIVDGLCGCTGCDSELYWSEWHNDPPRCCDPCDRCGHWTGPGAGGYRAPYAHPYYVGNANTRSQVAKSVRPPTRGITRKPDPPGPARHRR
jgi:hypothetical protein